MGTFTGSVGAGGMLSGDGDWATEATLTSLVRNASTSASALTAIQSMTQRMSQTMGAQGSSIRNIVSATTSTAAAASAGNAAAAHSSRTAQATQKRVEGILRSTSSALASGLRFDPQTGAEFFNSSGMTDIFNKALDLGTAAGRAVGDMFAPLAETLPYVGKLLGASGKALSTVVGGVGAVAGLLIANVEHLTNQFRTLSDQGLIRFLSAAETSGDALVDLTKIAARAELTIDQMSTMLQRNMAASVRIGAANMAILSVEVRRAIRAHAAYGMTVDDINTYTSDYVELQRRGGALENMNRAQLAAGTAHYLKQLTDLSYITGVQRRQIHETIQQATDDQNFQAAVLVQDAETRKRMMTYMTGLSGSLAALGEDGKKLGAMMGETFNMAGAEASEFGKMLVDMGAAQELATLKDINSKVISGEITADEGKKRAQNMLQGMMDSDRFGQMLRAHALTGNASMKAWTSFMLQFEGTDLFKKQVGDYADATGSATQAALKIDESLQKSRTAFVTFMSAFLSESGGLAGFEKAIQGVSGIITIVTDKVNKIAEGSGEMFGNMVGGFADILKQAQADQEEIIAIKKQLRSGNIGGPQEQALQERLAKLQSRGWATVTEQVVGKLSQQFQDAINTMRDNGTFAAIGDAIFAIIGDTVKWTGLGLKFGYAAGSEIFKVFWTLIKAMAPGGGGMPGGLWGSGGTRASLGLSGTDTAIRNPEAINIKPEDKEKWREWYYKTSHNLGTMSKEQLIGQGAYVGTDVHPNDDDSTGTQGRQFMQQKLDIISRALTPTRETAAVRRDIIPKFTYDADQALAQALESSRGSGSSGPITAGKTDLTVASIEGIGRSVAKHAQDPTYVT